MAEIVINNTEGVTSTINAPAWATEATQANIAKSLSGLGTSSGKIEALLKLMFKGYEGVTKATKEGDKEIADLLAKIDEKEAENLKEQKVIKQATVAQTKAVDDLEQLQKDAINELGKLNTNTNQQNKDLDKILSDMNSGSDGLMSFAGGMGKAGNVLGVGVKVATAALGLFGTAILGAATYITSQFTETFQFLNNGLKQGTGGIIGLTHPVENIAISANLAGMSLSEFGEFAQANSKILRQLSARGFADLYSKSLLASGGLLDIGMTAEDAVESVMTELEYRRRFGMVLNQDTALLRTSLMTSARELRIFANAVGMSEDELRQQSEIQESHVDLLQLQAKAMGANTTELVQSTQTISRQMGAAGLGDLINPLFEAISKGSTGLSEEFIEIGKVAPELIELVEAEAASFGQTGKLNAKLGKDMFDLFRNLSQEQMDQIVALQIAGDGGAVAFNNLAKNINKLSSESIAKIFSDLDVKSLSLLDTFNRLGFVVNQGTSSIGDMGKTAILAALGFEQSSDEFGNTTFDFNQGVANMSSGILEFTQSIFGHNSRITDSVKLFTDYISAMFGGQNEGESDADFKKRVDDARTAFVDTVSKFAQDIGKDLNRQLQEGTLFDSVKNFFKSFFDDLVVAINDATGGVLFDNAAHDIQAKRYLGGELSAQDFATYTGTLSGEERTALGNNLFRNNVTDEASRLGITNDLSQAASSKLYGGVGFDRQTNVYTKRIMKDLKTNVQGFDQLTEGEQEKLFNARVAEIKDFNNRVNAYIAEVEDQMHASGVETKRQKYTDDAGVLGRLSTLNITTDINKDTMHLFQGLRGIDTNVAPGSVSMYDNEENAKLVLESISNQMTNDSGGIFAQVGDATRKYGKMAPQSIANNVEYKALKTAYESAVEDGRMTYTERDDLVAAHSRLVSEQGFSKETKILLDEILNLINQQKLLTNAIKNDADATGP